MEALLEKEGTVESWNDERLDEMSRRIDAGFEKAATKVELSATSEETNRRFDKVDHELGRVNDRLDRLTYALALFAVSLTGAVVAAGISSGI